VSDATKELKRLRDWRDYYVNLYNKTQKAEYLEKSLKFRDRIYKIVDGGKILDEYGARVYPRKNGKRELIEGMKKTSEWIKRLGDRGN